MRILRGTPLLHLATLSSHVLAAGNTTAAEQAALQQIAKAVPACALQCLAQYVPASGCSLTDTACICTSEVLAEGLATCLPVNCTVTEALETQRFQATTCGAPVRSQQGEISRVTWALFAVSVLAVAGRFAARTPAWGGAGYGVDDWLILATEGIMTAITIIGVLMINTGLGKDLYMVSPNGITSVLRYFLVEEVLYSWCVCLTKMSIIFFYLRIFPDTVSTKFRQICFALIALAALIPIAFTFAVLFQCSPISYSWTRWDGQHEGTCINILAQIYSGAGVNVTFDIIVFALPIPRLLRVQISPRKKVGICMTFLVGLFVTICSLVRLAYLIRWRATTNPTWSYGPIALWSIIEADIGIVCACMPALAGPIKRCWMASVRTVYGSFTGTRDKGTGVGTTGHSRSGSRGWGGNRSGAEGGGVELKSGASVIMKNVSLNVSDEMELMDKGSEGTGSSGVVPQGGGAAHGYRSKW